MRFCADEDEVDSAGCYEKDLPVGRVRAIFCDTDRCNGGPVGDGASCTALPPGPPVRPAPPASPSPPPSLPGNSPGGFPNSSSASKCQTMNYNYYLICALIRIISTMSYL